MGTDSKQVEEWRVLERSIARLRAGVMAVVFGMVGGSGLFAATAWLLLRGGANVGQHLNLLGNYFPGYRVTWGGALLGFIYGALSGATVGWTIAWIYNFVAFRPGKRRTSRKTPDQI